VSIGLDTQPRGTAPKARPRLALIMRVLAGVIAAVAVGALVWDFVDPPATGGSPASQQGEAAGYVIGMISRTLILAVIALALFMKSLALANPALVRDELAVVAAALRDRVVSEPSGAAGFYAQYTDADLINVYNHLRPDVAPERFDELVLEIRKRSGRPG
jgi:hypothetical protein